MIIWIIWFSAVAWSTSKCEPPVNSYLPPTTGEGSNRPGNGIGNQLQPQDSYFPPGQRDPSSLNTKYGPPSTPSFGQASPQRGFGQDQRNSVPSSQYGAPDQDKERSSLNPSGSQATFDGGNDKTSDRGRLHPTYGFPNRDQGSGIPVNGNGFGPSSGGFGQRPDSSYGTPTNGKFQSLGSGFGPRDQSPSGHQRAPDLSYEAPDTGSSQNGFNKRPLGGSPSSSYGTPEFGSGGGGRGPGSSGPGFNGGAADEPAKYEFSYDVDDSQTGTKFGHSEQRDGDVATGEYYVVLPDGRKQVVEYEADLEGYKPQIRYEGSPGSTFGPGSGGAGGAGSPRDGGSGTDDFSGGDNNIGYPNGVPRRTGRPGTSGPQGFDDQIPSDQDHMGYPRGGPGGFHPDRNGSRGGSGGPSGPGGFNGQKNSQSYPSGGSRGNGLENYNDNDDAYPSGGPQGSRGFPSSGSQGNGRGGTSNEGYPSGGPDGPRGSGY